MAKSKFYQLNNKQEYEEIPLIENDIIELSQYEGLKFRLRDLFTHRNVEALSKDPLYQHSFGYLRNIGKVEGIEIGEKKRNVEIAKNLKSMNFSLDQIITATGLSREEIKTTEKEFSCGY